MVIALAGAFGGIVAVLVGEVLGFLRTADTARVVTPHQGWVAPGVRWVLVLLLNALAVAVAS